MPLIVIKVIIVGTVLLACASDTHNRPTKTVHSSPSSETVSRGTTTPSLVLEEVTVKIEISTKATEYIRSGVIVGNGHFAVTYGPEIPASSTRVEVTHVGSKVVTVGSIIYKDEIFGLVLIRLTDDLGPPVVVSQSMPNWGENLMMGDFLRIGNEDVTVNRYGTVAGFEFDGLVMRFDGIVSDVNVGGPALNKEGQLVGIVTHAIGEGELGSVFFSETFKYGLSEELVKYNETVTGTISTYDLDLIGIQAHVIKPYDWNILSGFGYFDIRAPEHSASSEKPSSKGHKVIGIVNADSSAGETSEVILNRLIAEFGEAFERVQESVIPKQDGLDKCALLVTVEEYSRTAFERRGHVIPGGWVSYPGTYTGLCTGIGQYQRVIVFAESLDVDDIVSEDGLFKKIDLVH